MLQDIVKKFFSSYPSAIYKKGEILVVSNIPNHPIYFLEQGHVRQFVTTREGKEITLTLYKQGAFFPMMESLQTYSNTYSFICLDRVTVRKANRDEVVAFLKTQPDILFDLLSRVYRGVEGLLSHMEQLMGGTATQQLATALLIATKRFGVHKKDHIEITLRLTHQDLADLTGLTRETVSRHMALFKKQKILSYTNTVISISDPSALEKLLT